MCIRDRFGTIVNNSTSIHIETPGETFAAAANNPDAPYNIHAVVILFLVAAFIMTVIAIANKWLLKR